MIKTGIKDADTLVSTPPFVSPKHSPATATQDKPERLPGFILFILFSTFISCVGAGQILGFNVKGIAWFLVFWIGILILIQKKFPMTFPIWIWCPWLILLTVYYIYATVDNSTQRFGMLICPILAGMAASTIRITPGQWNMLLRLTIWMIVGLWLVGLINTGAIQTMKIPEITGLAAEVMTAGLLACLFAILYVNGGKKWFFFWMIATALPVFAVTRMAILASLLTLPLTLAPFSWRKRILILVICGILGLAAFHSERVQRKMFYSGRGELTDLSFDNPNMRTTGRVFMWDQMKLEMEKSPWLGFGLNAQEVFLFRLFGFQGQPHNDWLRLRFDFGWLGTIVFGLCMLMQLCHAWWTAKHCHGPSRILLFTGAMAFIYFSLLMISDNIIIYASFFGNLHFTFLGLGYSLAKEARTGRDSKPELCQTK